MESAHWLGAQGRHSRAHLTSERWGLWRATPCTVQRDELLLLLLLLGLDATVQLRIAAAPNYVPEGMVCSMCVAAVGFDICGIEQSLIDMSCPQCPRVHVHRLKYTPFASLRRQHL